MKESLCLMLNTTITDFNLLQLQTPPPFLRRRWWYFLFEKSSEFCECLVFLCTISCLDSENHAINECNDVKQFIKIPWRQQTKIDGRHLSYVCVMEYKKYY